ncbi:hypothetical protein E2C01_000954 [Portunus trituberculatus]|uniref:Uncharacterized protein n=1 Tax=Portunus trituberculatus TaxID=210409 RepID=A0A5B7CGH0_PORTR|nr:hypothetical protein [Portunus trituberculatus]
MERGLISSPIYLVSRLLCAPPPAAPPTRRSRKQVRRSKHHPALRGRGAALCGGAGGEVCGREEVRHERGGSVRLRRYTVKEHRARVSERWVVGLGALVGGVMDVMATQHHQHQAPASGDADSSAVKPNMAGYLALRSMEENGKSRYFCFLGFVILQAVHNNTASSIGAPE